MDGAIWRVVGDPLVAAAADGPLTGHTVAVKDLFAVAGFATGAGVPDYLAESRPAARHAGAVAALVDAGAAVRGIARTDQLAYSIAGTNEHYGAPPNAAVPGAVPGGSSSGSATAVALGQASLGLGTDTAGSVRVPASYQGLWGLRATHAAVPTDGLLALAPSFDAVGWLGREVEPVRLAAAASLNGAHQVGAGEDVVTAPALLALVSPPVRAAFQTALALLRGAGQAVAELTLPDLEETAEAFRVSQAAQAWAVHGRWLSAHPDALTGAVRQRFSAAASIGPDEARSAARAVTAYAARLDDLMGDRLLLLPATPTTAPGLHASPAEVDLARARTVRLTSLASITGRPAVSAPLLRAPGLTEADPVGLCLVGPRHTDLDLLRRAQALAEVLPRADPPEMRSA